MNKEIITFNNGDIETLSMCPGEIDIEVLGQYKRNTIKGWLAAARGGIVESVQARFASFLDQTPKSDIPSHYIRYCPDTEVKAVRKYLATKSRSKFLCGTIYISTRYNVSCHQLLFGRSRPVELFGRTKAFVQMIVPLKDTFLKQKIQECLVAGCLETDSPMYILKERCMEIGFSRGMAFHAISSLGFGSVAQQNILSQIYAPRLPFRSEQQSEDVREHLCGYDMVLRDCVRHQISADYLILQDYSDFALLNGKTLSAEQKEWLSLYLCASPKAQITAVSLLAKDSIKDFSQRVAAEKAAMQGNS